MSIDYLYDRNELKASEAAATEWDRTADHLDTVRGLLREVGESLARAAGVRLYAAAGQVEVEAHAESGRQGPLLGTVVENPMSTQLVRLDYDVQVAGAPLRGEFSLSIRPTKARVWGFAATAGLALTLKGAASVGPLVLRGDGGADFVLENLHELLERNWLDAGQLLSIPILWALLWLADRVWRPLQEG